MSEVPLIIDNGSFYLRAGFAGDDAPRAVFPSQVRRPRHLGVMVGMHQKNTFVGDECSEIGNKLLTIDCFQQGKCVDWDGLQHLWYHTYYNECRVAPEEQPVLMTEPALNSEDDRAKTLQIQFEHFQVPSLALVVSGVLSLYSTGRTSGTVLDCGHGSTTALSVDKGSLLPQSIHKSEVGGANLTDLLLKALNERGGDFKVETERRYRHVSYIKEGALYIAQDFALEEAKTLPLATHELPDGTEVEIGNERYQIPEALFQPSRIGDTSPGIHELVHLSITSCDPYLYSTMLSNIVVCGGTAKIQGLPQRARKELAILNGSEIPDFVDYSSVCQPDYTAWVGGSVLATHSAFSKIAWKREEYAEVGPSLIQRSQHSLPGAQVE
eukprot:Colp12_sorted_trinity150504_noHs@19943